MKWRETKNKQKLRKRVYIRDNGECFDCGKYLEFNDRQDTTLHHVIPKCKGGRLSMDNIVLCCFQCNQDFGGDWPPYWAVIDLAERMYRWKRRDTSKMRMSVAMSLL